jgi:hypothetical protein
MLEVSCGVSMSSMETGLGKEVERGQTVSAKKSSMEEALVSRALGSVWRDGFWAR